jgi:hypothetical protein
MDFSEIFLSNALICFAMSTYYVIVLMFSRVISFLKWFQYFLIIIMHISNVFFPNDGVTQSMAKIKQAKMQMVSKLVG